MTRSYWMGVMFFSLTFSIAAGIFTYRRLEEKSAVVVPLRTIPTSSLVSSTSIPAATTTPVKELPNASQIDEPQRKLDAREMDAMNEGKRNILFTYKKASAKQVFIIGTFTHWTREPMVKNTVKKYWEYPVKLKPGTYEYKFIVDGRKIRDPNNRLYTPEGNSILKVKSLDKK